MPALMVIAIRLLVPLTILRWPLAGGLLSLVVDAVDVVLVDAIAGVMGQPPEFGPIYAQLDKWLDLYYLAFELVVARRWQEVVPRRTAYVLFGWRLLGVILFEITVSRPLLVVFPNLFENYFLFILIARRWFPRFVARTTRHSPAWPGTRLPIAQGRNLPNDATLRAPRQSSPTLKERVPSASICWLAHPRFGSSPCP